MNIYVANLSPDTTQEDLRKAFQAYGEVSSVSLLPTRMSGVPSTRPSRGMGFVVMPDRGQASTALAALHLHEIRGRAMTVQVARPVNARRRRR